MIITLTLNPALDVSVSASALRAGELNISGSSAISCGGKGLNVSRALRVMGEISEAFALLGGEPGRILAGMASREGVSLTVVRTVSPTRINVKIISADGAQTELNGRGGPVTESETEELRRSMNSEIDRLMSGGERITAVLSGSVPPGIGKSEYRSLTGMLKEKGVRVAVDASGEALKEAVEARPWLIKPNAGELEGLCGTVISDFSGLVKSAVSVFRETGVTVLATAGGDGAVYAGEDGVWTVTAPRITMNSFAGAGDTFLAAFLYRLRDGVGDALRFASSAAAAKVELEGAAMPRSVGEMSRHVGEVRADRIG